MVVLIFMAWGCAHYPKNSELSVYDITSGYRFDNLSASTDMDRLFIILTFSGGGTRAAALSYGVLETLRATRFEWQGTERSLLEEVDVISSVSGGSFTAAYYGLFQELIFKKFEKQFLYRDIEGELKSMVMNPGNWPILMSPDYSRTDLASDFYNRELFDKKRFDELIRVGQRPMIVINATDMSIGTSFSFVQSQFDPICSDLASVQIARAVTASSCFPVAFAPMTLNNYAGTCQFQEPLWVGSATKDMVLNPPRYARARALESYTDGVNRPYLHLLDGGVSDNIGLRGPLTSIRSTDPGLSVLRRINKGSIDHLVVIIVDAKTKQDSDMDKSPAPPGLEKVLFKISTVPLDNYSFDTVQALQAEFKNWKKDSANYENCKAILQGSCPDADMPFPSPKGLRFYPIYVGFDRIADSEKRRYFQNIDTSFHLPDKQVTDLRNIAKTLLEDSDEFQELKTLLNAK